MSATTWKIDPVHTAVEFAVAHMHVSTFRGRFGQVEGKLVLDEDDPAASSLQASVDVRSLEVREKALFDRLMGPDFFAAEAHPKMSFRSTRMERRDATHWQVVGELTLRGEARPLTLEVEGLGGGTNPFGGKRMKAFRATGALDRGDYGIKWNVMLDIGKPYLGETVQLTLQVELVQVSS